MKTNLIYGKNPIWEALEASQSLTKVFIAHGSKRSFESLIQLLKQQGVPIREVDRKKLTELVGHEHHQGIVASTSEISYSRLDDIYAIASLKNESHFIAVLDEIQDPHNLGAIIRSADAFGVHGIVIPKDRSVGITATVAKTSAGAVAHVPVCRVGNLAQTIDELKTQGIWIVGTDQSSNQHIQEIDASLPIGVIIGGEGKGMRRLIKEKCDFLVRIPMFGKINSLNASVASAIIFWDVRRKRERI